MKRKEILCGHDSEKLRIALDVESVLADTHPYFISAYNEKFDTSYSVCDIDNWDWVREEVDWEDFDGITQNGWESRADEINVREENLGGTVCELQSLTESTTIDIVTGRTGVESEMKKWLKSKGITEYENFISTSKTKSKLGYHVYIDDNPRLVDKISDDQLHVLIRGNHNRTVEEKKNIVITYTVKDAVNKLQGIMNEC